MTEFTNIPVTLIGASRGLGRVMAETFHRLGARVLVTGRTQADLDALARDLPGISVLACDAAAEDTPERVFAVQMPLVLILNAGAMTPNVPFAELDWERFSVNWNTEAQMSFHFLKAAVTRPLAKGATVVTIGSGAVVRGSLISASYAGAKRMQMYLTTYAQAASDRADLGLRFVSVAPARIMRQTELGAAAITAYAAYNGASEAAFIEAMGPALMPQKVADAVVDLAGDGAAQGNFLISVDGVSALS